jgi:hypothetical protein
MMCCRLRCKSDHHTLPPPPPPPPPDPGPPQPPTPRPPTPDPGPPLPPQSDQKRAKFFQPEGDHLTLLAVYEAWKAAKFSNPWCHENFLQVGTPHARARAGAGEALDYSGLKHGPSPLAAGWAVSSSPRRSLSAPGNAHHNAPPQKTRPLPTPAHQARALKRAQDVRKQLIAIMDRYKLDLVSAGGPSAGQAPAKRRPSAGQAPAKRPRRAAGARAARRTAVSASAGPRSPAPPGKLLGRFR